MTALGIIEDRNGLLPPTDCGSGMENGAMRNRCVVAAVGFLVALGLLLCVGRESVAKQPSGAPAPAVPATSHESVGQGPESAPNSGQPTAEPEQAQPQPESTKPVRDEPANPDPASQPAERPAVPHPAASEPASA